MLKTLSDPFLLPEMTQAIDRVLVAIDRREHIVLYGDYDVDGVTSLAILARVLRAFGAQVDCFLPMRVEEGYGLTADGLERCLSTLRPNLLIAADCGTSALGEIEMLMEKGIDTIVVDHHECQNALPRCVALVNPSVRVRPISAIFAPPGSRLILPRAAKSTPPPLARFARLSRPCGARHGRRYRPASRRKPLAG